MRTTVACASHEQPVDESPRRSVYISAQLIVRGTAHRVAIATISRFAAIVADIPPIAEGSDVELEIAWQGPDDIRIAATVVSAMHPAIAARLGRLPGARLQFHEPIEADDAAFEAAITYLLAQQPRYAGGQPRTRAAKPTDRMPEPVQTALVSAMTIGTPDADGRLVLAGDLSTIPIADVLTALARLGRCGRLEVTHDDILATLDVSHGYILDVRSSIEAMDRAAFLFRLLSWRAGTFRLLAATPYATQACRLSISQLLMEHAEVAE